MKKSHGFLPKILSGEKTIESRWYSSRRAPWNTVRAGDTIYFKDSGEPVTLRARVKQVLQFENLNPTKVRQIVEKYGDEIGISPDNRESFCAKRADKKYCILIFLDDVERIEPFQIDKSGFGNMSAWISVDNVNKINKDRLT